MIRIKEIAYEIPQDFIDNLAQCEKFGESEEFARSKIGSVKLPRIDAGTDTSDLVVRAVEKLLCQSDLVRENIDALVVVTQNPDGSGLPHTSAIAQEKLGLSESTAAFDVSLGCSGYVYGLSLMKGLMQETGLKNGVLVTADPYSKVIDLEDRVTSLLFGDAASATWLCEEGAWDIGRPIFGTDGSGADSLKVIDGRLAMNGRQVFNFASTKVPKQIKALLSTEALESTDIDQYCIHQGSAAIVDAIARRFPEVRDRFELDLTNTGNTVSSSIPILLSKHLENSSLNRILLSGFGVGLSWASNILTRRT